MANGWGGYRPGSGPKPRDGVNRPVAKRAEPKRAKPMVPAQPKPTAIDAYTSAALMRAAGEHIKEALRQRLVDNAHLNPFKLPAFPEEATPPKPKQMALDNLMSWGSSQFFDMSPALIANEIIAQGLTFLGYPYLAQLTQRPEYRTISEIIADDSTRRWIDFDVVGDEEDNRRRQENDPEGELERRTDPDERAKRVRRAGKTDKVKELRDDQARLNVRGCFYDYVRNDGFFGRSHTFFDLGQDLSNTDPDKELATPILDWAGVPIPGKIALGSFRRLDVIEPMWAYPTTYNATNPLARDWYKPQVWYVLGKEIHVSRIPPIVSRPVPDMLKPAYAFGGLSLSQIAKPYIDKWLVTSQSVADMIRSFSVMVLETNMGTQLLPGGVEALMARADMFNLIRDNMGLFMLDKTSEEMKNVSAPLGGLGELKSQSLENICSVSRIPLVKYTGISPKGLNASSEGEIQVYDDTIGAYQERTMRAPLKNVIDIQQLSLWGEIDPEITFHFEPLRVMTDKERAEKQKMDVDRDKTLVDVGAISPEEVRHRVINDPDLPYTGLDPDDVPEPPAEESMMGQGESDPDDGGGGGSEGGSGGGFGEKI